MDPFEDALPSSSTGGAGDGGFFAKERQRLIGDISKVGHASLNDDSDEVWCSPHGGETGWVGDILGLRDGLQLLGSCGD